MWLFPWNLIRWTMPEIISFSQFIPIIIESDSSTATVMTALDYSSGQCRIGLPESISIACQIGMGFTRPWFQPRDFSRWTTLQFHSSSQFIHSIVSDSSAAIIMIAFGLGCRKRMICLSFVIGMSSQIGIAHSDPWSMSRYEDYHCNEIEYRSHLYFSSLFFSECFYYLSKSAAFHSRWEIKCLIGW